MAKYKRHFHKLCPQKALSSTHPFICTPGSPTVVWVPSPHLPLCVQNPRLKKKDSCRHSSAFPQCSYLAPNTVSQNLHLQLYRSAKSSHGKCDASGLRRRHSVKAALTETFRNTLHIVLLKLPNLILIILQLQSCYCNTDNKMCKRL